VLFIPESRATTIQVDTATRWHRPVAAVTFTTAVGTSTRASCLGELKRHDDDLSPLKVPMFSPANV